ncbi:unnamed protein product [Parascedosporium putredinis]|uniref:F-box domain-containing protein n=1 Tax=Parascedosporium putredinis TaxID=1442378 RepID=A0A9P1H2E0_9PEZI|nr:unnamed protein product [Parascedosporium putredinis]CAI7994847.1 unnamed protein product [Parascedosporium putredinis]
MQSIPSRHPAPWERNGATSTDPMDSRVQWPGRPRTMAAADLVSPLLGLPLHLVTEILSNLHSLDDVAAAVSSARIFNDAFAESSKAIAERILGRIPNALLPFVHALRACRPSELPIDHRHYDALHELFNGKLKPLLTTAPENLPRLSGLTVAEQAEVSRTHAAVEAITQRFAAESAPLFGRALGLEPKQPAASAASPSEAERFRIGRALYRLEMLREIFCADTDADYVFEDDVDSLCGGQFFAMYSPWVNEQLFCLYGYLRDKVYDGFCEVAAHDVEYAQEPPNWIKNDADTLVHVQMFSLFREPQRRPFPSSDNDREDEDPSHGHPRLSGPFDGPQDGPSSCAYKMWVGARGTRAGHAFRPKPDRNLWACGYVIWEYAPGQEAVVNGAELARRLGQVRSGKSLVPRRKQWREEERKHRVVGLTEAKKRRILEKWASGGLGDTSSEEEESEESEEED